MYESTLKSMHMKNMNGKDEYDTKCRFIIQLGKAAHAYGSPAIRLESYLKRLSQAFGIKGEFQSTPTDMIFAFQKDEEDWQKIHVTSAGGGLDLTKLPRLDELVNDIIAGKCSISDADTRLKEIDKSPDPYGNVILAIGYAFLGAGIAGVFSGSWTDILFSSLISLVVFAMVWQAGRKGGWVADWLPLSSAFVAGLLAVTIKHAVPELNYVLVTVAGIIVLVPGYSVSIGVAELVNNHVVSGLSNLTNGLVYLFKQFLGAWLAFSIVIALGSLPSATSTAIDPSWNWACVPAMFIGLILVFQTSPRYLLWALVSCSLGYGGVLLGSALMGSNLGNLLGAVAVGVFANVWEWKSGRPGSIVLLPAITTLVSGSIGLRGLVASAQGDAAGSGQFMEMFLIAITLTAGLLIANTIVKPKKSL
jgi:uncharacterized membrane protein YjjP (DUF1212 family)